MSISSRQKCKKGSFSCRALNPFSCIKLFFGCPQNDWWKTGQLINRFEFSFGSRFCSSQPFSIHWKVEYPYLALVFRWFDCPVMVIFFSSSIVFPLNSLKLLPPLFPLFPSPPPPQPLTSFHPWRPLNFFSAPPTKYLLHQKTFPPKISSPYILHIHILWMFWCQIFQIKYNRQTCFYLSRSHVGVPISVTSYNNRFHPEALDSIVGCLKSLNHSWDVSASCEIIPASWRGLCFNCSLLKWCILQKAGVSSVLLPNG